MDIKLQFDFVEKHEVTVTVKMTQQDYEKAIKLVPIPDYEFQGLEHSGENLLYRLAQMNHALMVAEHNSPKKTCEIDEECASPGRCDCKCSLCFEARIDRADRLYDSFKENGY